MPVSSLTVGPRYRAIELFMVALWNRQTIIFLPCDFCLSIYLLSFFPRLISAVRDWMSTILIHMAWLSANLECRSETCCTRLAANTGRKKVAKNRHLGMHHRTTLSGYIFATKANIDNRKKLLKQQYLFHMSLQYGELRPTIG